MKKKGLIISTVVMVVVLIAALTTTTFAWFTNSASAEVGAIELSTTAADGLQIASVSYSGSAVVLKNGEVRLSNNVFSDGDNDGFGSSVTFDTNGITMYGVTGNGEADKMLTAASQATAGSANENVNNDTAVQNGKPQYLVTAQSNKYYFTADLAIQITGSVTDGTKLIFKSFKVTGTGTTNAGRMAAAARIAFIPIDPDGETATASAGVGTTEAFGAAPTLDVSKAIYFHPYYDYRYASGQITKASVAPSVDLKYNNGSAGAAYSASSTDTLKGSNYVGTADALSTEISEWNLTTKEGAAFTEASLGTYSASDQVIYLRVLIWFEGEDSECIQGSTGSGLTVSFEFDKGTAGD